MCLTFNAQDVVDSTTKRNTPGKVIRYKVLEYANKKYYTPSRGLEIKQDVLVSNRNDIQLTDLELCSTSIKRGIHVCTTLKQAKNLITYYNTFLGSVCVILEVECDNSDLVMSSSEREEEVYMKVKLKNLYGIKYYWLTFLQFIGLI
jgi:hypothetical protein